MADRAREKSLPLKKEEETKTSFREEGIFKVVLPPGIFNSGLDRLKTFKLIKTRIMSKRRYVQLTKFPYRRNRV